MGPVILNFKRYQKRIIVGIILFLIGLTLLYFHRDLWVLLVSGQKMLNSQLTRSIMRLKKELNVGIYLGVLMISLVYGVFHAVGPGHGKSIIISYFMRNESTLSDSLKLALMTTFTHIGTAVLLSVLFRTILAAMKHMDRQALLLSFNVFSGLLVMGFGGYLLFRERTHSHEHLSTVELGQIGFSAGIVPCPMSLTILLFSIRLKVYWVGLTAVLATSLGMAGTLFAIGLTVREFRRALVGDQLSERLHQALHILSASLMILIGLFLVISGVS